MPSHYAAPLWLFLVLVCVYGCRAVGKRESGREPITFERPEMADAPASITVRSSAFSNGAAIPDRYADYGGKTSPPLEWSGVPEGAKSVALIVDDPDAPRPTPYVHWVLYKLAATVTRLPEDVPKAPRPDSLGGALQGKSDNGSVGYFGPRPPPGGPHHYHFQVFALDNVPALDPGATKDRLLGAMNGHVLAKGQLVGTYQKPK
jgi:Raf kinase inhibitor-like YbhB/YbcL family protein